MTENVESDTRRVIGLEVAITGGHSTAGAYLTFAAEAATILEFRVWSITPSTLFLTEVDVVHLRMLKKQVKQETH